jgi:soluble lytic murein transglycosylase-like protein
MTGRLARAGVLLGLLALAMLPPRTHASEPALKQLETKAAIGDVSALNELANRLELGIGMTPDPGRAMALFCRAALAGSRTATFHVAGWLLSPDGPDYDPALAAAWLHRQQRMERGIAPPRGNAPACPTDTATGLVPAASALARVIEQVSRHYGVDPDLVKAVIEVESSYRGDAVSPAGAAGLMQLMPESAQRLNVTNRFDVEQNLRGGVQYLARLLHTYPGQLSLALAAYNAGEGPVNRCGCVPAIPETMEYVNRIRALYPPPDRPGGNGLAPPGTRPAGTPAGSPAGPVEARAGRP